jgi:hypothetical protein
LLDGEIPSGVNHRRSEGEERGQQHDRRV